ncbi:ATP-binding protein [Pseudotabrizicola sediminis]
MQFHWILDLHSRRPRPHPCIPIHAESRQTEAISTCRPFSIFRSDSCFARIICRRRVILQGRRSPVGGKITIDARLDNAALHYIVSDEGPGIPRSVANQLFSRPIATSKRSNGIGLFLAQEALECDGGQMAILDAVKGASISLIISRCGRSE